MPVTPNGTHHHQPIFRRDPGKLAAMEAAAVVTAPPIPVETRPAPPLFMPLCVFAAGRQTFRAIARDREFTEKHVKALAWTGLPLSQHGWDLAAMTAARAGAAADGSPVWQISRGA